MKESFLTPPLLDYNQTWTEREIEVLQAFHMYDGDLPKVCEALCIARCTVKSHMHHIYAKLGLGANGVTNQSVHVKLAKYLTFYWGYNGSL